MMNAKVRTPATEFWRKFKRQRGALVALAFVAAPWLVLFNAEEYFDYDQINALQHLTNIEAMRSIGTSDWTIITRHSRPGTVSTVVVFVTMHIGTSIITAASLSFLGMGAQQPKPEWGAMGSGMRWIRSWKLCVEKQKSTEDRKAFGA